MKKFLAIVFAFVLCLCILPMGVFAADYDYVTVTGTMNGWNPASEADRMAKDDDGTYTITYENLAAGSYEFKFTANGNWSDLDLGGSFLGSGVWSDLYWGGSNICFTLEEAGKVTICLDAEGRRFMLTIGDRVDEAPAAIKVHITALANWAEVYAYVWGPEHLGTWAGTKVENGVIELPAAFEGMVINNGSGSQSRDIKDIDLTAPEVWITVHADGSYTLSYDGGNQEEPVPDARPIKINVTADHWNAIYAYTYNPELDGTWPGTLVENGVFETLNIFEGLVLSNGEGQQTADIKDIDLSKYEVWITVNADNSYSISYEAPVVEVPGGDPNVPSGDNILACAVVLLLSAAGLIAISSKKEN